MLSAAGNADGDLQTLLWATLNDRTFSTGKLGRAPDDTPIRGWAVVDMKSGCKIIFPFGKKQNGCARPNTRNPEAR